jgi:uncharacterized membrane protein
MVATFTPAAISTTSSSPAAGKIAGGVVGGIIGLAVVGGLIFFMIIRRRRQSTAGVPGEGGADPENPIVDANNTPIPLQPAAYGNPEVDSNSSNSIGRIADKVELGDDHEEAGHS